MSTFMFDLNSFDKFKFNKLSPISRKATNHLHLFKGIKSDVIPLSEVL